jgi:hypothetical protein
MAEVIMTREAQGAAAAGKVHEGMTFVCELPHIPQRRHYAYCLMLQRDLP